MSAALDMGFIISFAGNVTFPKAQNIREAAKEVPLERMLIETDSPFLAPVPHRGKRNEPAFVKEVARQLGELRGIRSEEHTSELQSHHDLVCRLLLEKKKKKNKILPETKWHKYKDITYTQSQHKS